MSALAAEHSQILKDNLKHIQALRREHPGVDDVMVLIDCVGFPSLAQTLGLTIPPKLAEVALVLAMGSVKLERCKESFPSHSFPSIAKALQKVMLVPTAYRVILVTKRGASSAQCIYLPDEDASA